MGAIVIEHVKVSELPEAWRTRLRASAEGRVTVRIEEETEQSSREPAETFSTDDPAFGIWRDRDDVADVASYVRKLRAPRFTRD